MNCYEMVRFGAYSKVIVVQYTILHLFLRKINDGWFFVNQLYNILADGIRLLPVDLKFGWMIAERVMRNCLDGRVEMFDRRILNLVWRNLLRVNDFNVNDGFLIKESMRCWWERILWIPCIRIFHLKCFWLMILDIKGICFKGASGLCSRCIERGFYEIFFLEIPFIQIIRCVFQAEEVCFNLIQLIIAFMALSGFVCGFIESVLLCARKHFPFLFGYH